MSPLTSSPEGHVHAKIFILNFLHNSKPLAALMVHNKKAQN